MVLSINGNSAKDLLEWKKLPKIDDDRVEKCKFFNAYGYSVTRPDGFLEMIVGENSYKRTIDYLARMTRTAEKDEVNG